MVTKFKVNDEVVIKETQKLVSVSDFEFFNNLVLYYTSDGKAYPEDSLRYSNLLMCILSGETINNGDYFKHEKNIF
jgi:hypothetical protein